MRQTKSPAHVLSPHPCRQSGLAGTLVLIIGAGVAPSVARGDDLAVKSWVNLAGGSWNAATNWSPAGVPAAADPVLFTTLPTPVSVTGPGGSALSLTIDNADVEFVSVNLSFEDFFEGDLRIGTLPGVPASLTLIGGAVQSYFGGVIIAGPPSSLGTLEIVGAQHPPIVVGGATGVVVGGAGQGTLLVRGGTTLANYAISYLLAVGSEAGGTGHLEVAEESTLVPGGPLIIRAGDALVHHNCTLGSSTQVVIAPNGTLRGAGKIVGGQLANFGTIEPGEPIGTLSVSENYVQFGILPGVGEDSGALTVSATGQGRSIEHDRLVVEPAPHESLGTAALAGLLELRAEGRFDPAVGVVMEVLSAPEITSPFDVTLFPGLPGRYIRLEYAPPLANGAGVATVSLIVDSLVGDVGFGASAVADLQGAPRAAAFGDIDGDADAPDLAFAIPDSVAPTRSPGSIAVLFDVSIDANGNLVSSDGIIAPSGVLPSAIRVADIDDDGDDDVVAACTVDGILDVYFSDGASLGSPITLPVGSLPMAVSTAALDGTAGLEIIAASSGSPSVWVYTFDGGNFRLLQQIPVAAVPCTVDPTDLDLDGAVDLVVGSNGGDSVTILVNDGTGSLHASGMIPVGDGPIDVQAADLNGDGFPEIVTSNSNDGSVSIARNLAVSPPGFAPPVDLAVGASGTIVGALALVDLGEDKFGDLDIVVVAAAKGRSGGDRVLRILRNDTTPGSNNLAVADAVSLTSEGQPLLVITGNLDADMSPDLLVLNEPVAGLAGPPISRIAALPTLPLRILGDLDGDGAVGAIDLAMLLGAWNTPDPLADLDRDGTVGQTDLAVLLGAWTPLG